VAKHTPPVREPGHPTPAPAGRRGGRPHAGLGNPLSLRARIIAWTFLPTMVILGAVALYTFGTYARVTETLVVERNRKLTGLLAAQMAVELTAHLDALEALARSADLETLDPAHVRTALQWWVGVLRAYDGGVVVLDAAGTVIAADPRATALVGADWSGRAFYQRARAGGSVPFFSDVEALEPDGRPAVAAILPLGNGPALRGAVVGLFELHTPLRRASALYASLSRFQTRPVESRTYLVDSRGRLIDPERQLAAGQDVSSWEAVAAGLGTSGAVRARGLGGRQVIASFAPVPDTPWTLYEEEDWLLLTAATRPYGQVLLALLILGLALPPALLTYGLRRALRPVADLTEAARQIAAAPEPGGAAPVIPPDAAGDEIDTLQASFEAMSLRLRALYGTLERQVAERTHELATLNAVSGAVNASLDLRETLRAALETTLAALGAPAGLAYYRRPGSDRLELVARGAPPEVEAAARAALAREGLPEPPPAATQAPLEAQGEAVGGIWIWPPPGGTLPAGSATLLRAIGQGVGAAADNARLYAEVERAAVVSERQRIARELHDSVTQTLFSANLIAGVLPLLWERNEAAGRARLDELHELTQGALAEMRMLLLELRPEALEASELPDLLAQLRDAVSARARLPVALELQGAPRASALPPPVRLALYRIAQEALNNAVRHAAASRITMALAIQERGVRLEIADDGRGFNPASVPPGRLGMGGMAERMAALGGRLQIVSHLGAGARVIAEWEDSDG